MMLHTFNKWNRSILQRTDFDSFEIADVFQHHKNLVTETWHLNLLNFQCQASLIIKNEMEQVLAVWACWTLSDDMLLWPMKLEAEQDKVQIKIACKHTDPVSHSHDILQSIKKAIFYQKSTPLNSSTVSHNKHLQAQSIHFNFNLG